MINKFIFAIILLLPLSIFSQNLHYEWFEHYGGTGEDEGYFIAKDNADNIYLTGKFSDTATFADTTVIAYGGTDAFLAKFDTLGNLSWIVAVGGTSGDEGVAISFDSNNNIYFTGQFHSATVYFADTVLSSCGCSQFSFVSKFTENGDLIWVHSILGSSAIMIQDHKTGVNNDIIAVGYFYLDAYLGNDTIPSNGVSDIFIIKYDSFGNIVWYYTYGGTDYDDARSIEFDSDYNMYITGSFKDQTFFGFNDAISRGQKDAFFAKLDYNGIGQWVKGAGSPSDDESFDLTLDSHKNIYITGYMNNSAEFDDITLYSQGYLDFFLAKYDSIGNILWANSYGGVFDEYSNTVAVDEVDNVYVTGKFIFDVSIDSTQLSSNTFSDIFFAKFSPSGNNIWAKQLSGERNDEGFDILPIRNDVFFITGFFRDSAIYDTTMIYAQGLSDIYFSKLTTDLISELPDLTFFSNINIFPNPTTGLINISAKEIVSIEIYDIRGNIIEIQKPSLETYKHQLDLSNLSKGIYLIKVQTNSGVTLDKIILE